MNLAKESMNLGGSQILPHALGVTPVTPGQLFGEYSVNFLRLCVTLNPQDRVYTLLANTKPAPSTSTFNRPGHLPPYRYHLWALLGTPKSPVFDISATRDRSRWTPAAASIKAASSSSTVFLGGQLNTFLARRCQKVLYLSHLFDTSSHLSAFAILCPKRWALV